MRRSLTLPAFMIAAAIAQVASGQPAPAAPAANGLQHIPHLSVRGQATQDALAVDTKIDLAPARDGVPVCALDGRGIPELRRAILRKLSLERDTPPGAPVVFTGRQEAWIRARLAQR